MKGFLGDMRCLCKCFCAPMAFATTFSSFASNSPSNGGINGVKRHLAANLHEIVSNQCSNISQIGAESALQMHISPWLQCRVLCMYFSRIIRGNNSQIGHNCIALLQFYCPWRSCPRVESYFHISDMFWCVLMCFDMFWYVLICFDMFCYVLIYFDMFWYVLICFDMFWYDLIWFDMILNYLWHLISWFDMFW